MFYNLSFPLELRTNEQNDQTRFYGLSLHPMAYTGGGVKGYIPLPIILGNIESFENIYWKHDWTTKVEWISLDEVLNELSTKSRRLNLYVK